MLSWDAIWFGSRSLPASPREGDMPQTRGNHQKYILWEIESAGYLFGFKPQMYNNFFNWTVTYRQDSTVSLPYGWAHNIKNHPEGKELKRFIRKFGKENTELSRKQTGNHSTVAWMVSNCLTESNREGYIEKLKEFIDVDIYGGCYDKRSIECKKDEPQKCWDMIARKYKFYLSFENSICKDYVTEKFFDPLQRNIIPVVLGGANYSQIAPPHSYIDAFKDFAENPEGLARYLKKIAGDDALYASYFWWKDFYSVGGFSAHDRARAPCKVCELLHQQGEEGAVGYEDLHKWWVGKGNCQSLYYDREILSDLDGDDDDEDDAELQYIMNNDGQS